MLDLSAMAGLPTHFLTVQTMSSSKMAGWLARGTPLVEVVNNTLLMQLRIGYSQTVYVPQDTRGRSVDERAVSRVLSGQTGRRAGC